MNGNKHGSSWVDPDDAPELTDDFFKNAKRSIGNREVSRREGDAALLHALKRGRPPGSLKTATTIRFDDEVLAAFRAGGPGWQTRMNAALKDWLKTHHAHA